MEREIGKGKYGLIKLGEDTKTGRKVAIKIINKKLLDDFSNLEEQMMAILDHPHIVHLYEVFETDSEIALVMEYAPKGDLYQYIKLKKKISEEESKHIFVQIVSGLSHSHKLGIVHRDIKAENIFFDSKNNVLIGDWGFSCPFKFMADKETSCGSLDYSAPEILTKKISCGPSVDIWALGS